MNVIKRFSLPFFLLCSLVAATAAQAAPVQVTNWGIDTSSNGRFQSVATNPKTGAGLVVTFVNDGTARWQAIPLNAAGAASGSATNLLSAPDVYEYANPAVEYDPVSGDWVVCLGTPPPTQDLRCWFLNGDGTVKTGSPFPVSTGATGGGDSGGDGWQYYHSISIAYSAQQGKWLAAFGEYYNISTNWFDKDGNVTRGLDLIADGSGDGGLDLAYSPKSDKFMVVGRWRTGSDTQDGAYVWYLNGDGTLISGPTRVGDGTIKYKNPVIAYNAVRDEFLVANFQDSGSGAGDLTTQRYKASDGSDVAGEKANALGASYLSNRNRLAIDVPDYGDSYLATTMLGQNNGGPDLFGNYALPLDGTGALGTIETVVGPDEILTYSQRPRIAFNQATCSYLVTYNNKITSPATSWELFSSSLPATDPCKYGLAVTKGGAGSGTVSSVPAGIDCGANCTANFDAGASVTLTATAASGSAFTGWSGACVGTATCTVTLDAAKSVTATFAKTTYSLTTTTEGTGTISGGGDYAPGTVVTLTATPGAGFKFDSGVCPGTGWTAAAGGSYTCAVTVDGAKTASAKFVKKTAPKLVLKVTTSKKTIKQGQTLKVTGTLTNSGDNQATKTTVCLTIPKGFKLLSYAKGGKVKGGKVCWKTGNLDGSRASKQAWIKLRALRVAKKVAVSASATASNAKPAKGKASVQVKPAR